MLYIPCPPVIIGEGSAAARVSVSQNMLFRSPRADDDRHVHLFACRPVNIYRWQAPGMILPVPFFFFFF